jgi:hypothetical protein
MKTDLPLRPKLDDRIMFAVAPDEKRRLFEVAAERRVTVSELVRTAILQVTGQAA